MIFAGLAAMIFPLILIGALIFVFWIIMLVDCVTRKFKGDTEKIVWVLVIILAGILGALIYYFVVYYNDKNKSLKWLWITLLVLAVLALLFLLLFGISASRIVN